MSILGVETGESGHEQARAASSACTWEPEQKWTSQGGSGRQEAGHPHHIHLQKLKGLMQHRSIIYLT